MMASDEESVAAPTARGSCNLRQRRRWQVRLAPLGRACLATDGLEECSLRSSSCVTENSDDMEMIAMACHVCQVSILSIKNAFTAFKVALLGLASGTLLMIQLSFLLTISLSIVPGTPLDP